MIPQRISLITLGAVSVPGLRAFYQKLGWQETATSSDRYAVFQTVGVLLSIYPLLDMFEDIGLEPADQLQRTPAGFRGMTLAINVDRPEQVDEAIDSVREAGARILRGPYEAFWGGRIAYFADPEQNVWEVAWNPTAVFDERGAMLLF